MQAFDFQNSKDSMEITQISHLVAQVDLDQQAHTLFSFGIRMWGRGFPLSKHILYNVVDRFLHKKYLTFPPPKSRFFTV